LKLEHEFRRHEVIFPHERFYIFTLMIWIYLTKNKSVYTEGRSAE